jgi:hypothetical protein
MLVYLSNARASPVNQYFKQAYYYRLIYYYYSLYIIYVLCLG